MQIIFNFIILVYVTENQNRLLAKLLGFSSFLHLFTRADFCSILCKTHPGISVGIFFHITQEHQKKVNTIKKRLFLFNI